MTASQRSFECPECKKDGIKTVFDRPTSLGVHRRFKHGVAGKTGTPPHVEEPVQSKLNFCPVCAFNVKLAERVLKRAKALDQIDVCPKCGCNINLVEHAMQATARFEQKLKG